MKDFLISIITVSFNSEETISQTIESVLNQTDTNIEYIIVDGGSTDKTFKIINSYKNDFSLKGINYKFISEPDTGIYNAFNSYEDMNPHIVYHLIDSTNSFRYPCLVTT